MSQAIDKKIFGTLFFSIFAAVTGVGIVVPLLPVYASDLGASGLYIGFIFGSFSLSSSAIGILVMLSVFISGVINMPMGYMADRVNRKVMITIGGILVSAAMVYFSQAQNIIDLVVISCLGVLLFIVLSYAKKFPSRENIR